MSKSRAHPACPHCFYLLSGHAPDQYGRTICPECGRRVRPVAYTGGVFESAKGQLVRDILIGFLAAVLVFGVPIVIFLIFGWSM